MSAHSASPSPLQTPANGQVDDMPKGHCRYILLLPEIRGQRCACVNFSLNKDIPGSTCDCGHLACFHNKGPDSSADQKQELELLKKRLQHLEEQLSRGHEDVLDSVVSRLNEVEEHLEKSREEFSEQIKGAYRNISMSWRSIQQAEQKSQQHDDQLRQIYDKLRDHDERLDRLHAGQLELRDADLSLEERIENLTETLEEEEEIRLSAAMATRLPRRRSTSDTSSRPNGPLGTPLGAPLGAGAAPRLPYPSPTGGPHHGYGAGTGRDARASTTAITTSQHHPPHHHHPSPRRLLAATARPTTNTGAWTVHISLLPHAYVPMPFERNTTAYQRCLSRGLHQMVAVQGRDAASFRAAVEKAFGRFLRGREWMPLQAKLCDAETLQGLPMLRLLDETLMQGVMDRCDHEFLRRYCAVVDAHGVIDSLYIAMKRHTLSWHTLRHSPVFMEGLEGCWAYDALLDTDPFDGDMAVDDEDRPAVGDIMTAVPPPLLQQAGLKRPLAEMSRSSSFSSGSSGGGEQARVKRTCPAPPQGAIVEIRRRDIKTA
ncbi:hypothetical protein N657DRAFT_566846 [Parathielavia appendiculata]|uniref:Uncharacterized protein n=1 Tax=Parathielavia appendiculata TaxID=2587402 RepID=A0AAN6U8G1_9PEZI|nr:hypothetical protein N657DRAFT_566846 [Parathielavia appendiculata]